MNRILCLILILFVTQWAQAQRKLQVSFNSGEGILCHQEIKSEFWACDGKRLLFIGETIVGQVPTLHSLVNLEVNVPARIFDLNVNKALYSNPQNFQYQQAAKSAAASYYRKHNLMMSFEPRLRACALADCQKLKQALQPVLYQKGQITAALGSEIDTNLLAQAKLLTGPTKLSKTAAQMVSAFEAVKVNSSLRYDYLKDGCFARSEIVAAQLAAQGFEVYKIWIHGFLLWGYRLDKPKDFFGWRYHVAPVVKVNGQLWVFDPGLFLGPVVAHQWVNEVFGPNQKAVVTNQFSEEEFAEKAQVAVSLSAWQMYPQYVSAPSAQAITDKEISADVEDARMILEELGNLSF